MARGRTQSGLIIQTGLSSQEPHPLACFCGARFTLQEVTSYERHVVACAKANDAYLNEVTERHKAKELGGDKELEDWVDDHRIEIIEGRKSIYGEDRGHWRQGMG